MGQIRLTTRAAAIALPSAVVLLGLAVTSGARPPSAGALPAVDATGDASVSVQASPTRLRFPDRLTSTLTITITTGAQAQTVSIGETAPSWRDRTVIGGSIDFGAVSLRGPGRLSLTAVDYSLTAGACVRGALGGVRGVGVSLPARTTTVLVQRIYAAHAPRWRGVSYTPRLSWGSAAGQSTPLAVPAITMAGPPGVHIRLRAEPPLPRRALPPGHPIVIAGTTSPALQNARVHLSARFFGATGMSTRGLGVVRTDRRGHFRATAWRPRRLGVFQVVARYVRPRGRHGVRGDSTCGLSFRVAQGGPGSRTRLRHGG